MNLVEQILRNLQEELGIVQIQQERDYIVNSRHLKSVRQVEEIVLRNLEKHQRYLKALEDLNLFGGLGYLAYLTVCRTATGKDSEQLSLSPNMRVAMVELTDYEAALAKERLVGILIDSTRTMLELAAKGGDIVKKRSAGLCYRCGGPLSFGDKLF